jgi:hypothetical protein
MKRYALLTLLALPLAAQGPMMPPPQLDSLVQRIALYPDSLLAQVLTASTYWDQVPEAAAWADQHSYLQGPALAQAIEADRLPWDPSLLALLPFPSVLDMMAQDPGWTQALGARPRPGFAISAAIGFGPRIAVGAFVPFGWRSPAVDWRTHAVVIDGRPWERRWDNRREYVHPYAAPVRRYEPREHRESHERKEHDRH